jgi:hypothetical protein
MSEHLDDLAETDKAPTFYRVSNFQMQFCPNRTQETIVERITH